MFGDKFKHHMGNIKHHLGQTYHKTKHFLGQVDNGIRVAKKIYGVVAPVIDHFSGGATQNAHKHVMKAIGGYEQLRNKVMDTDATVHHNIQNVYSGLKKKVPELGLN